VYRIDQDLYIQVLYLYIQVLYISSLKYVLR